MQDDPVDLAIGLFAALAIVAVVLIPTCARSRAVDDCHARGLVAVDEPFRFMDGHSVRCVRGER